MRGLYYGGFFMPGSSCPPQFQRRRRPSCSLLPVRPGSTIKPFFALGKTSALRSGSGGMAVKNILTKVLTKNLYMIYYIIVFL